MAIIPFHFPFSPGRCFVRITLQKQEGPAAERIPFIALVEVISATIDQGKRFEVPVHARYFGLQRTFVVDVCGLTFETPRPEAIPPQLMLILKKSINCARFPSYVFIARRARKVYPVYAIDDEVFAVTPNGHVFRHVELAKVREYLSDYLHDAHILGERGLSDKLHVRGVSKRTLELRRPVFYLKKRVPRQIDFWAPVFETADQKRIYTYAASVRREVPLQDGLEVLVLRELVAHVLITDRRLHDLYDLRADRLMPLYWERLCSRLDREGTLTVNEVSLPLFSHPYGWFALEARPGEQRYGVFAGKNVDDLFRRVQLDFNRRGINGLNDPTIEKP